jgi:hypothetical protein
MIRTITPVSWNPIDLNKQEIVFAKVTEAVRNDEAETYTLSIKEWIEQTYTENVPIYDENGNETGLENQTFTREIPVRNIKRVMTFEEADQLTNYIESVFTITDTGAKLRKTYTILGHLVINNQEAVRNVAWELVPVQELKNVKMK